jgi:hypothetical protein
LAEAQAVRDKALAESDVWEEKNVVFDVYKKVSDDIFDAHHKAMDVACAVYDRAMGHEENDEDEDEDEDDENDSLGMQRRYDHVPMKRTDTDDPGYKPLRMQRRYDHGLWKRLGRTVLLIGGAIIGMFGFCLWAANFAQNGVVTGWESFPLIVCMLAFFAGVGNVVKLLFFYRCPQCRARLARVPGQDGDPILYVCPTCKVEWDTGWTSGD